MAPPRGGSVTLASNHLVRGISRSSDDPSLSAELHAQGRSGWLVALWAATSRAQAADDTSVEMAATLGWGGALAHDWSWRASYAHYASPWQEQAGRYRYNEATLDLQWRDALLLSASWSPDTTLYSPYTGQASKQDALAWEASYQHTLPAGLSAFAGAGYYDVAAHAGDGYWYGSAGLGWTGRHWRSGLSYVHTGQAAQRVAWPGTAYRGALLTLGYVF